MTNPKKPRPPAGQPRRDAPRHRPESNAPAGRGERGARPDEILAEDAADADFEASTPGTDPARDDAGLVRLNKYLADHGVASRRKCDELIATGQVTVDGVSVTELGTKIDPTTQVVEIDGVHLKPQGARKRYYVLNKPSGVVCTNEPRETRPRAVDLITDPAKGRIYTIGRLDEESKGLILLTNDGEFANRIMHPRYGIEKTYVVRVAGRIDDDVVQKIREGVHLSEGRTSGARILVDRRTNDSSQLTVTIHEGMNREIRRVFARFGYKVTELRRVRIGPLTDRGLKPGRWRELLFREVEALERGETRSEQDEASSRRGPPKRFPKKKGYARDLIRGGKLVPGASREREPAVRFGPKKRGPSASGSGRGEARRPGPGARSTSGGRSRPGGKRSGGGFGANAGGRTGQRPQTGRTQRGERGGRR